MAQVLYLFHENAADLFPRKVQHQDTSVQERNLPLRTKRNRSKPPPNVRTPIVTGGLLPEDFPEQISQFAEDITTFLECLNEFPEFTDEAVNASILAFQGDLKVGLGPLTYTKIDLVLMPMMVQYWASCLGQYSGVSIVTRNFPHSC